WTFCLVVGKVVLFWLPIEWVAALLGIAMTTGGRSGGRSVWLQPFAPAERIMGCTHIPAEPGLAVSLVAQFALTATSRLSFKPILRADPRVAVISVASA